MGRGQELSLNECRWLNDAVLYSLLHAMQVECASGGGTRVNLVKLDLSWTAITDESLALTARLACDSLRVLKARGCSLQGRKTLSDAGACSDARVLCPPCRPRHEMDQ